MAFFKARLSKKMILLALSIGFLISICHLAQVFLNPMTRDNIFAESPYTKWISIDPFSFTSVSLFILIPLIASIPAATLLRQDINNHFFKQLTIRKALPTILKQYALTAFLTGALTIAIILLANFLSLFLILPNVKPDDIINNNLLITSRNTLLVALYYQHPFVHALLSIVVTSLWGGLFALFTFAASLLIKNNFVALCSSLFLQIILFILNSFIRLPNQISLSPMDFLRESASANINLAVLGLSSIALFVISSLLIYWGGFKKIVA